MASSLVSPSDNGSFTAGFGPNMAWAQINLYYFLIALFVHRFLSPLDAAAAAGPRGRRARPAGRRARGLGGAGAGAQPRAWKHGLWALAPPDVRQV
jgi:hypothetical protein